jgi:hypothetical protein
MKISGKVYETYVEQKTARNGDEINISHIVLRKTKKGKEYFIDFTSFDYEGIKKIGVMASDKVSIKFTPKSRRWNDKYFTSIYIDEIEILGHSGTKQIVNNQLVNIETGEVIGSENDEK